MENQSFDARNKRNLEKLRLFAENSPTEIVQIFDIIPLGICITDAEGNFVNVNQVYCDFYGYSREELIGKSFLLVVPKEHRAEMQHLHDQFMGLQYEMQGKWKVTDREGKLHQILSNAAYLPATDTSGPCKMTFIVEAEKTEKVLYELEWAVQLLEKKISAQEVAQQLSNHDLRNNLASILQIVEILLNKDPTDEQKMWLSHLKRRSDDTLDMIKATSDYAQMEQGGYEPQKTSFSLIHMIRQELANLRDTITRKQVQISLQYQEKSLEPEQEVKVSADKFYIERMFHNLLLNALEASPEQQEVSIAIEHNGFFRITIHNGGVIPSEMRSNFFDKFSTSGKEAGTGLGTYIAKLIVEMHSGTIAYRSNKVDGTDVIIHLPSSILLPENDTETSDS
ncbi:PAS domain-containing sensor histidine kinase [Tunicatimonas pelagia]|uniref:PAS domain-containing sensor histidine kinase n=1 Tax=Tunicatimonas pelagia TaxID=931531 RepID=UPI0026654F73|nr:PAS domain-containing sensor histidine kinase [Tunicatimonas pelagia]WKN43151.1 PAS domain-containing sensor histidine kinase [Tunicatimonas pelagia]